MRFAYLKNIEADAFFVKKISYMWSIWGPYNHKLYVVNWGPYNHVVDLRS